MQSGGEGNVVADEDDFTYTEDASGTQKKVPVEKEFVFKVVVLGDYSVGKTCLIKRLLSIRSLTPADDDDHNSGTADSDDDDGDELLAAVTPTVGTDFYSLVLANVLPGISLRLQLWDTAGLEKYAAKYENTFRNASFVICVFDVTSTSSLHNVVDRHLSIAAEHIPELDESNIMVVANKIDIIADMENNTTALRDARKRSQSPEAAFAEADDEDTATNTDFFTTAKGVDKDAIVTAKKVQAEVFELFGEVHYAEVSAKTRQHVRSMLRTVAFSLLRNTPEASSTVAIPETESAYEVFGHTMLPMQTPGSSPIRNTPQPAAAQTAAANTPQPPTPPPPPSLDPPSPDAKKEESTPARVSSLRPAADRTPGAAPPPKQPTASWSRTGAFKFDMAPPSLATTAVFSPMEGTDAHSESQRNSPRSTEMPSATAATVAGPSSVVSNSRTSAARSAVAKGVAPPVTLDEAQPQVNMEKERAKPDPNETPQQRKEREQAEMRALLGRAGQRKQTASANGAAAAVGIEATVAATADALHNDADKMEDEVAAGRDQASENAPRRPTASILDSLGMQEDKNKGGTRSDDDEDGAQLQARLKDRFAQIEHDIRQDNAVARDRTKREKKAKGKCKCVLM